MSIRPRPDLGPRAAMLGTAALALIFALILWAGVCQFDGWFKVLPVVLIVVLGPPVILVAFWSRGIDEKSGEAHMSAYQGPATLIRPSGSEHPADVDLTTAVLSEDKLTGRKIREWYGTANVPDIAGGFHLGEAWLRLPDGREGRAVIHSHRLGSGHIEFHGDGAPPFGPDESARRA